MKAEIDGDRFTVEAGPGARQAALDNIAAYFHAREAQKTKRLLMAVAAVFAVVAAVTVVFAPQGRESWAQWVGLAMVVFALGAAGYSQFSFKCASLELKATRDDVPEERAGPLA
jgi:hypothetical protein